MVMDFTPEDMEAVQACLEGIDRNVSVTVEPAAAVLLMPNTVCTVGDICPTGVAYRAAPIGGRTLAARHRGQNKSAYADSSAKETIKCRGLPMTPKGTRTRRRRGL